MGAALGLFRLQQVDNRLTHAETRLRKIQELLANDAELQAATQALKAAEADIHRLDHDRRAAEEAAQEQEMKIQQAESSLYGGKVQNPKELQELQADVASLKKRLASFEEQQLDAMVQLETAQSALQSARKDLDQIQARLGESNRQLLGEQTELTREVEDLQTERQAALSAAIPAMLESYERLRQGHRGVAVVEVADNSCGGCGTTLTAALQQSARHAAELVFCPTCGRILFAS